MWDYGLAATPWTQDLSRAPRLARDGYLYPVEGCTAYYQLIAWNSEMDDKYIRLAIETMTTNQVVAF